jgi:hypothetical protein
MECDYSLERRIRDRIHSNSAFNTKDCSVKIAEIKDV